MLATRCGDEQEPGAGKPADGPTTSATAGAAKVARAARLAREEAAAIARLPALDAAPLAAEFANAVQALENEDSQKRFARIGDDWLPKHAARGWREWNVAPAGPPGTLPAAFDRAREDDPFAAIVDLETQLAAAGVHLLLVPVPSRLQLEPELVLPALTEAGAPVARVAATTHFLAALAKAGVESVDLAPPFMEQRRDPDPRRQRLYLRGNNHWTPRAAELAAKVVATRLAEMECYSSGRFREDVDFDVARRLGQCRGEGVGQAEGAPPEAVGVNAIEWRAAAPTAELARTSPILLLGDSFAGMHKELHASFVDQLVRFTGWPIDVIAPQGGAELACREALSRRDTPLAGKQVVIWLLPEPLLAPSGVWRKVAVGGQ